MNFLIRRSGKKAEPRPRGSVALFSNQLKFPSLESLRARRSLAVAVLPYRIANASNGSKTKAEPRPRGSVTLFSNQLKLPSLESLRARRSLAVAVLPYLIRQRQQRF
jgi:hypothetical protein